MVTKIRQALVIGGTTGIGRAIADRLIEDGLSVCVTGANPDNVAAIKASGTLDAIQLDVADHAQIDAVVRGFDTLDVLVNCAGTNRRYGQEFEAETFDMVVDINLSGTMRTCYAALPLLKASDGACIVNIASMFSIFGSATIPGYASSKAGVVALTRSLALAWAEHGILVNAIAPGFISTKLTRDVVENAERTRQIKERTPMGRWGNPEDLAGPASFLCSRDSSFVTGTLLTVDGGYSAA